MNDHNTYTSGLLATWLWIWGLVLVLLGVLVAFNVSDTYFDSTLAPSNLTTDAVILGVGTMVLGAVLLAIGAGIWMIRPWAWWAAISVVLLSFVSDIVNFGRTAAVLGVLSDPLPRRTAVWPIIMWREGVSFLGTANHDLFLVTWPLILHLVVSLVVLFVLASPQLRELFGIRFGEAAAVMGAPIPQPARFGGEATRVPAPHREEAGLTSQLGVAPQKLAYLIVQSGPGKGSSFQLKSQTTIGRDRKDNDVVLNDTAVSREHAIVRLEDHRFIFMDRGSVNRSFLVTPEGTKEITKHVLVDGDELLIGETRVLYREGQALA